MATFLVATTKSLTGESELAHLASLAEFGDIAGDVHETNIGVLAGLGITSGKRPGQYDPSGRVTRGQLATFVLKTWMVAFERALGRPPSLPQAADHFTDDDGDTHQSSINVLAELGIAGGANGSPTRYEPGQDATRLEMAQFLAALLDLAPGHGLDPVVIERLDRDQRIERVIADAEAVGALLDRFWTDELATLYGVVFDVPDRFEYYFADQLVSCGGSEPALVPSNAYYCFADGDEHVAFDMDWLVDLLVQYPTGVTTYFILAHEWGHAVQDTLLEVGVDLYWVPGYRQELNADCLAGAFFAEVTTTGHVIWEEGDFEALFTFLAWSGGPWMAAEDHGSSAQRLAAFEDGWTTGTHDCLIRY